MNQRSSRAIMVEVEQLARTRESSWEIVEETVKLLHERFPKWNWVGVYLLSGDTLILGPYVGKPTDHTRIRVGVGVCGSAVAENANIIVDDVTKRENYLACTLETRSEIVVLIRHEGKVVAQFDIDSDEPAAFTKEDEELLQNLAPIVAPHCEKLVHERVV